MRIGILTGGGDCPALNAVIRAAVKTSVGFGWEVLGIEEGFDGLVHFKTRSLTKTSVSGILHLGGTILGTTNAANPFSYPTLDNSGTAMSRDISDTVVSNFQELGLDALIVIGGDGTLAIAEKFYEKGIPVVGVPANQLRSGSRYAVWRGCSAPGPEGRFWPYGSADASGRGIGADT